MSSKRNSRKGIALIMVLVLIVMLSLGAYAFTNKMTERRRESVMMGRRAQADAAVVSGVEYLKDYLAMTPEDQAALGGHWDNPAYFKDVMVGDEAAGATRFAIISVVQDAYGEPTGIRYGLEDQGIKININEVATADRYKSNEAGDEEGGADDEGGEEGEDGGEDGGDPGDGGGPGGGDPGDGGDSGNGPDPGGRGGGGDAPSLGGRGEDELEDPFADPQRDVLMKLPLMTEAIADSILDWIDEDSTPRPFGAEADSYAYVEPSNGPISSLDELLLVESVTPELLYGADRNHNLMIDESEQEAAAALVATTGSMARGWSAYLTVNSKDVLAQLEPIDLNQDDLQTLYDDLVAAGFDEDFATYVAAYRQNGPYTAPPIPENAPDDFEVPEPEPIDGRTVDLSKDGGQKLSSVLDLIGSSVQGNFEGGEEPALVQSPFGEDSDLASVLPDLVGGLTTGESGGTGRLNTNACSSAVLSSIPDLDDGMVQGILGAQDPGGMSGDINYMYPTWPLAQGLVTVEQMKAMLPYVSASGVIYQAQILGYSEVPGVFSRAEVVIDASDGSPRILSWRDLTHLGPGLSFDTLTTTASQ